MKNRTGWLLMMFAAGSLAGPGAQTASAGDFSGLMVRTLREFGFNLQYENRRGTFPGGFAASGTAAYTGQQLDFGMVSLTLTGPVTFGMEYSDRLGPSAEFYVNTANQPLSYVLDVNTGVQDYTASGLIVIDASTEFNPFGFYDLDVLVSNRGEFTLDGYAAHQIDSTDFDVGPISVSGNIFVDALAAVAEPFFVASGQENPFSKFSGRASREAMLAGAVDDLRTKVEAGETITDQDMTELVDATVIAAIFGIESPDMSFLGEANFEGAAGDQGGLQPLGAGGRLSTVPEPISLLLVGGGSALWLVFRRKVRSA